MKGILACRTAIYGKYQDGAFEHLSRLGVKGVEIACPPPDEAGRVMDEIASHGLQVTSVTLSLNWKEMDIPGFVSGLEAIKQLGAKVIFTSINTGGFDRQEVYRRLRQFGDKAAEYGVVIAMETHPDLVTNGDVAVETMKGIDHPNVRINFDTANVYFYNHDVDAVSELRKVIPYVASIHLKDTNGEYQAFHFGALGEGVVDFPGILKILEDNNFAGPLTMEMEGIAGEELSREEMYKRVEDSVAYLKRIGLA
ncbi:MAG: sugar phosphate isomerase/epimerase [Firmicutes bacterium]|nr:sugar phosphate isomerase/epimerase [Bacillota bacterium]